MRRLLPLRLLCAGLLLFSALAVRAEDAPPRSPHPGFVYVADVIPDVVLDMRFYGENNFTGGRVDGYNAPEAILSVQAANALKRAADTLRGRGYRLKIFDAYRPQAAVDRFERWARDARDTRKKADFYPDLDKSRLFALGYIAKKSAHSRGNAVDLTLVDMRTGRDLDMGSPFDFFGPISRHGTLLITPEQAAHREVLKKAMMGGGFTPYIREWWHYTLAYEPSPAAGFNFAVE